MKRILGNYFDTQPVSLPKDHVYACINKQDSKYINDVLRAYWAGYATGELTYETTVRGAWTFLDDYDGATPQSDFYDAFKAELLSELIAQITTTKPLKGARKRTRVGTPPPQLRRQIPLLVDSFIAKEPKLKKLPVDANDDELDIHGVFETVADNFRSRGFPETNSKIIYDEYYGAKKNKSAK
jgi:hypothetical protein